MPGSDTEGSDDAHAHEAIGSISTGEDIYQFMGVPTAFDADSPWEIDLYLDMGTGWVEWMPTFLNAADVEVRSEGAHYILTVAEPGMILRDELADAPDEVVTGPNTIGAGNVKGGTDSWRVWPPVGLFGVADNPAQYRVEGGEWQDMAVCSVEMEF